MTMSNSAVAGPERVGDADDEDDEDGESDGDEFERDAGKGGGDVGDEEAAEDEAVDVGLVRGLLSLPDVEAAAMVVALVVAFGGVAVCLEGATEVPHCVGRDDGDVAEGTAKREALLLMLLLSLPAPRRERCGGAASKVGSVATPAMVQDSSCRYSSHASRQCSGGPSILAWMGRNGSHRPT